MNLTLPENIDPVDIIHETTHSLASDEQRGATSISKFPHLNLTEREIQKLATAFEELAKQPIPELPKHIVENHLAWKDGTVEIPIRELEPDPLARLVVVPGIWEDGKIMAAPNYYRVGTGANDYHGIGELVEKVKGPLQYTPLIYIRPEHLRYLELMQEVLNRSSSYSNLKIVLLEGHRDPNTQTKLFETYKGHLRITQWDRFLSEVSQNVEQAGHLLNLATQEMVSMPPDSKESLKKYPPPHMAGAFDYVLVSLQKSFFRYN